MTPPDPNNRPLAFRWRTERENNCIKAYVIPKSKCSLSVRLNSYSTTYNTGGVNSRTDNFQPDFVFGRYNHVFLFRFVAGWITVRTKLHIGWNALQNKETNVNVKSISLLPSQFQLTWCEMKHDNGPISANIPTLLTCVTTASSTSPLNGRNTIALYLTGYTTKPWPGWMTPEPIWSMVVTAITKPYFPVHVPSTSVYNFCFTVSISCGPKYFGCNKISCSNDICLVKSKRGEC